MKTKAQIVGELLKDGKINADDAVVLLQDGEVKYVYINQPYYYYPPYQVYCGTGTMTTSVGLIHNTLTNN